MTEFEKKYMEICSNLKKKIVPHKTNLKKFRLGNMSGDGGYVVSELESYDALYSYGCNDMITFEKDFYNKYKKPIFVYDHTTDTITDKPDYLNFFKEGVWVEKTHNMDTIDNHIKRNGHDDSTNLFLQMDIEGCEWMVFQNFEKINNFSQIVVEFHLFDNLIKYEKIIDIIFDKLNENFVCTHIHGTNAPLQPWLDANFPRLFEVTYVRKDKIDFFEKETEPFPLKGLDVPTDINRAELCLNYWL